MCLLCTVTMADTSDAYIISLLEYHRSLFVWFLLPSIIPGGQRTGRPSSTAGGYVWDVCLHCNKYKSIWKENNGLVTHNPEMYTPLPRKACWRNNGISAFQKNKESTDILVCYASTGRMRVYIHNGEHKAQHMTNLLVMANEAAFWHSMLDSISKICK